MFSNHALKQECLDKQRVTDDVIQRGNVSEAMDAYIYYNDDQNVQSLGWKDELDVTMSIVISNYTPEMLVKLVPYKGRVDLAGLMLDDVKQSLFEFGDFSVKRDSYNLLFGTEVVDRLIVDTYAEYLTGTPVKDLNVDQFLLVLAQV
jgi:hypothetical protein